jgi:hypothetical protein
MIVESTENILGSKLQLYYNVCGSLSWKLPTCCEHR